MCKKCEVEYKGVRAKGTAILSKLLGRRACKHSQKCECFECNHFRQCNPHADTGILLGDRPEEK